MTDTSIRIQSTDEGIELSQPSPSKEFSITGLGGRTDVIFISDADLPRVMKVMHQRLDETTERYSL